MEDNLDGRHPLMEDIPLWKTTFNGKQPLMENDFLLRDFEIPLCHILPLRSFLVETPHIRQLKKKESCV